MFCKYRSHVLPLDKTNNPHSLLFQQYLSLLHRKMKKKKSDSIILPSMNVFTLGEPWVRIYKALLRTFLVLEIKTKRVLKNGW